MLRKFYIPNRMNDKLSLKNVEIIEMLRIFSDLLATALKLVYEPLKVRRLPI